MLPPGLALAALAVMARVATEFTYYPPKGDQATRYELIRSEARTFAYVLTGSCLPSRELDQALDHLGITVMLANAAIARNE